MATPSAPNVAFAELSSHSLHLAVVAGRKVLALRSFSLDAKADIGAFVAENNIAGLARATFVSGKNFVHRSGEGESGAVRQPAALQGHASRLPHGFQAAPYSVVVDAATGAAPDATRVSPWLLVAVDATAVLAANEVLTELGLAAAGLTLAAPAHFGVVAASLATGETTVVLVPGESETQLVWVTSAGVQSVAVAPVGYVQIFEAVQQGLGLKFKAAAGKLFYNVNYDFGDAGLKIAELFAAGLKPTLASFPVTHLHMVGLVPAQVWLVDNLAKVLALKRWTPDFAAVSTKLNLDTSAVAPLSPAVAGLLPLLAAGGADAPWLQSSLESVIAKPKTSTPFAPAPVAAADAAGGAAKGAAPVGKQPAKIPARPAPAAKPAPAVVEAVKVESADNSAAVAPKSKTGLIIGGVVGVVVVGAVAAFFLTSKPKEVTQVTPPVTPAMGTTSAKPTPMPTPVPTPAATPALAPAPTPTALPSGQADLAATDPKTYKNERYRFDITDQGLIRDFTTVADGVLVESAAGISLQCSYVGTDGRRKYFNAGGVDDPDYKATVAKSVQDGVTTFTVKITHSRFEVNQTFRCYADHVKISATFKPINLADPRGGLIGVYAVRLAPSSFDAGVKMVASDDAFVFTTKKTNKLRISFDTTAWARDGAGGRQTMTASDTGVAFNFTDTTDAARKTINYQISLL